MISRTGLISVFILSLAPSNPTNALSSTPSVSADALAASQSEPSYARSPHDVAAVLRWGLRHLKLEGNSFGRPALNPTSPSTNTHTTSSDVNNNTFTDDELSWYTSFSRAERSSNYPPTAFSQSLVPLLPEDHAELLVALLDVISSLAAHGEANGSSGAKFSMMIGLRLVAASRSKSRDGWVSFYERWEKVGRVLGHLLLARIRYVRYDLLFNVFLSHRFSLAIFADMYYHCREEASTHKMPRRLTELVEHYPYTKYASRNPSGDIALLPRTRFSTRRYDALFVRPLTSRVVRAGMKLNAAKRDVTFSRLVRGQCSMMWGTRSFRSRYYSISKTTQCGTGVNWHWS